MECRRSHQLRVFSSLSLLMAITACAPSVYRADLGAMFVTGDGAVALQNSAGSLTLHDEQNSFDGDMGLGDLEASPYLRVEWEHGEHRMRAHGFGVESSGSGTLSGDYGNISAGSSVNTSMQFFASGLTYSYRVLSARDYRVGIGAQLDYYRLDVAANSGSQRENVVADAIMPMPYAEAEYFLGPVVFGANLGVMSLDVNDANGRYLDLEATVRWRPTQEFEVLAGYRHLVLDAFGQASSRDFDADIDFGGFFVGGGVRF
ncbi:MAG: hypothetical protein KDC98_05000 [Planctomycetes bacterium]|nr:hypothetical protein [Planctomycetota bacterium]